MSRVPTHKPSVVLHKGVRAPRKSETKNYIVTQNKFLCLQDTNGGSCQENTTDLSVTKWKQPAKQCIVPKKPNCSTIVSQSKSVSDAAPPPEVKAFKSPFSSTSLCSADLDDQYALSQFSALPGLYGLHGPGHSKGEC